MALTSKLESEGWEIIFTPHLSEAEWQKLADLGFWDYCYKEFEIRNAEGLIERKGTYDLTKAQQALKKLDWITIVEVRIKNEREISDQEAGRIRSTAPFTRRILKGL